MYLPILQIHSEDMPPYAIVCGDPRRAKAIADKLDKAKELSFAREYRTFAGEYDGVRLAVVSHGVGSPGAAVCFEELIRAGVRTLIRVGTCGSYHADIPAGSLVISKAAAREEGLTKQLVPSGYPAVADSGVVAALEAAAADVPGSGVVRTGITVCYDAFFTGVEELPHRKYKQAGVLAVEMEIAALYVVSSLRGARAGAILAVDGFADEDLSEVYDPHTDAVAKAVDREIEIALQAVARLARSEQS
ncbi:nucleoside phosphorylase [Paenibacillus sp. J2TS4]|uniref:nucleoside phosphorylase n=1 Tax=Paenibacillus sp. J2TS4 TaxID=2807194 RepID=UPI001B0717AD|nr:nucleoside phosphorylase [Paenibacillus sp. J2TS4]GIP35792.1 uridine phosphorylase [Paenibacillus sp. J2TS4]